MAPLGLRCMSVEVDEDEVGALVGLTAEQAAKLAGIELQKLAAWERIGLIEPETRDRVGGRLVRVFGLSDLVELLVARHLEERGVSVAAIRRVVGAHRNHTMPHPLRQLRWATDNGRVYVGFDDGLWAGGRNPRQGVFHETIDLDEVRAKVLSSVGRRAEEDVGQVEHRPRTLGRKAVFAGTRTPVDAVLAYMRRGMPNAEILEAFPHLTEADLATAKQQLASA